MYRFLIVPLLLAAAFVCAAEPEELARIQAERDAVEKQLIELREKYIRGDKALQRLRKQIVDANRELSVALDARKDVRALNDKLLNLDQQLRKQKSGK